MNKIFKIFFLTLLIINVFSCQRKEQIQEIETKKISPIYANGFSLEQGDGFWIVKVLKPWTGAQETFSYLILEENTLPPIGDFDATIQLPIQKVILTSTTQIPHLDLLNETKKLIGFPNLDLISSPITRDRIKEGEIIDLGAGASANTELIIDTDPNWIMVSTLGDDLRYLEVLKSAGIPAVINGEYVEQHPLGRAEWIKFTGILLGKYEAAKAQFEQVEQSYLEAEKLATSIPESTKPSVLSGVMYQDIWYAPGRDSWGAKILDNAGGKYVFEDQEGTGSVQLNYEFVLDQAIKCTYWIGTADFSSIQAMGEAEPRYKAFEAWKLGNVYSYTHKRGETGGLEYFELGYMRPDLILKDLIKILHPKLLPDYELYFYEQLHEK
ncbi:ABC transporter substrate-binding protein [Algoriphagus halophilus]|uniref:ABC transporter substrate-binding protein n=1 Tax=Algoriphagus halophilus TaxID=226505 RepID=UPI00358F8664